MLLPTTSQIWTPRPLRCPVQGQLQGTPEGHAPDSASQTLPQAKGRPRSALLRGEEPASGPDSRLRGHHGSSRRDSPRERERPCPSLRPRPPRGLEVTQMPRPQVVAPVVSLSPETCFLRPQPPRRPCPRRSSPRERASVPALPPPAWPAAACTAGHSPPGHPGRPLGWATRLTPLPGGTTRGSCSFPHLSPQRLTVPSPPRQLRIGSGRPAAALAPRPCVLPATT